MMNPDWKTFLQENGAEFVSQSSDASNATDARATSEHLVFFDNPESEIHLSSQDRLLSNPVERGLVKVTGADAESFLQNQLSNDIRKVTETKHQVSAWCSPKGRIIASFRIFKRDDAFYLAFSQDLLEAVVKKLRMYVMMSKVVIEDVSDSIIHFTFAGKNADKLIQDMLAIQISPDAETIQHNTITLVRSVIADASSGNNSSDRARFDVFVKDIKQAKTFWQQCKEVATPVSGVGTRYLNIISAHPEISAESSEAWIPQMVNYIHINGVDFKKGCYPGQEVVARLNYLGKSKRRMYRLEIDTDQLPAIGAKIKSEKNVDVGKILNAVLIAEKNVEKSTRSKITALAVLKIADALNPLSLVANDATITLLDLPYSVDDGE